MKRIFIVLSLSLLTGCAYLAKKVDKLNTGMSQEQVIGIVGTPKKIESNGYKESALVYEDGTAIIKASGYSHPVLSNQSRYYYAANSLKSQIEAGKRVVILPMEKGITVNDLQFQEYSVYVSNLLRLKGYEIAPDINHAETAVYIGYGVSEPQTETYEVSKPVYGMVNSGGTSTFNSQTNVNAYGTSGSRSWSGYGNANTNGSVYTPPQYGAVGVATHHYKVTNYSRYLVIEATDLSEYKKSKTIKDYWKTVIVSSGPNPDLRHAMPKLVAASYNYIEQNTGGSIEWFISDNDPMISLVSGNSTDREVSSEKP